MNTLGKYKLVAELGQGGMADVILALAQGPVGFNKLVVIKRLRSHLADDPEFRDMLIDEARLAARLNHTNIVHTNEVGEVDGCFFMAMEFLEGQPLTRIIRRAERTKTHELNVATKLRIIADVLDGLHYAHELCDFDGTPLNVVHRDVTPSNIFVTYDGAVKIVDFGIAKASGRSAETKTGVVKGKMSYIPPEQAMGTNVDRRADLYSVGVMLWEAVTGTRMWKDVDDVVILGKLIKGENKSSPKEVDETIDDEIDRICRTALAHDPDERYATAADFQADLEAYMNTLSDLPTNRQLGRVVASLYDEERKQLKEIIDSQVAKLAELGAPSLEPVVIEDPLTAIPGDSDMLGRAGETLDSVTTSDVYHPAPRRQWLGLAAVLVAAAAATLYFVPRSDQPETATGRATSASDVATTNDGPDPVPAKSDESSSLVKVSLRANPSIARFRIDGGNLLSNPYVAELPRDGDEHEIVIEAEGYEPLTRSVHFERNVLLDVTLKKASSEKGAARPRARRARAGAPEPAAEAPPPPPVVPSPHIPKPKPKPTLLEGDPWK